MKLGDKRCVPCERGTMPFTIQEAETYMKEVKDWKLSSDSRKITKDFKFKDFTDALAFVNRIGAVAESEGHHPDIGLSWGKASVEIMTHKIGGLSENDFILASKIDGL